MAPLGPKLARRSSMHGAAQIEAESRTRIDFPLTNYLNAVPAARTELQRYTEKAVSIVTWTEVMAGAAGDLEATTRNFLSSFDVIAVDEPIAERAVRLRRDHRIKLPDAVIWATAQVHALLLVSRNVRDFPADDPGVRAPYSLRKY